MWPLLSALIGCSSPPAPEEVVLWRDPELQVHRIQHASRTPGRPVLSEAELSELFDLSMRIRQHLAPLYGVEPSELVLDMELKLTQEGRLVIKQARPSPMERLCDDTEVPPQLYFAILVPERAG